MRYQISHKNSLGCEIADDSEIFEGSVEDARQWARRLVELLECAEILR